ncbi:MAG: hypothetical protein SGPRY_011015, partial [Prymnesium sp.]
MLSTDSAEYGVSGVCTFGRTLLVIDDTALLVGVPDARGGAGTVLVYDITHPLNPQKLCEWGGSKYQWRYGQSLARGGPLRSGLVLIAVGSLGSPSVVVRQLAVDATRGKPECIGHAAIDGIIIPKTDANLIPMVCAMMVVRGRSLASAFSASTAPTAEPETIFHLSLLQSVHLSSMPTWVSLNGSARNGTLKTGDRVLVSMTAYNKVQDGLPQGQQSSQQLVLDLSPPFGGTVRVRSRSAMMAYRCFELLCRYRVCAGRSPLECDLADLEDVESNVAEATLALATRVTHGERVCFSVEAINAAGLASARVSSNCVQVDETPPEVHFVGVGESPGSHVIELTSPTIFIANAIVFEDLSNTMGIEWCVGTSNDAGSQFNDVFNVTSVELNLACDLIPPRRAGPDPLDIFPNSTDTKLSGFSVSAHMSLRAENVVKSGVAVYVGARADNTVGLWSPFHWSEASFYSSVVVAAVNPGSAVVAELSLPEFDILVEESNNDNRIVDIGVTSQRKLSSVVVNKEPANDKPVSINPSNINVAPTVVTYRICEGFDDELRREFTQCDSGTPDDPDADERRLNCILSPKPACTLGNDAPHCLCLDACDSYNDKVCDDGGVGSTFNTCPLGSDCSDCGPRDLDKLPGRMLQEEHLVPLHSEDPDELAVPRNTWRLITMSHLSERIQLIEGSTKTVVPVQEVSESMGHFHRGLDQTSSLLHDTDVSFELTLDPPTSTTTFSTTFDAETMLSLDDPLRNAPELAKRLVPMLMAQESLISSMLVRAHHQCASPVEFSSMVDQTYSTNICSPAVRFVLKMQLAPLAIATWAESSSAAMPNDNVKHSYDVFALAPIVLPLVLRLLDGSQSSDYEGGYITGYLWSASGGLPLKNVTASEAAVQMESSVQPGSYDIILTVTDDYGAQNNTRLKFMVHECPPEHWSLDAFT